MNAILCHYWHHPPGGAAPLFVAQREFPNVDEGFAQMGVYYQQLLTLEVVPQLYNTAEIRYKRTIWAGTIYGKYCLI